MSKPFFEREYDIAIIGAGITGCSVARELSKFNLNTILIDREPDVGFGTSKANSGIIHAGFHSDPNSLKGKLVAEGNKLYEEYKENLKVPLKRIGEFMITKKDDDLPELKKYMEIGKQNNVPNMEIMNQEKFNDMEPNIVNEVKYALYAPSGSVVCPYTTCFKLARNAKENGVDLFLEAEVVNIKKNKEYYIYFKGYSRPVKTKIIINAAGLYADKISKMAEAGDFHIIPRKGEEYLLDKKFQGMIRHLIFPMPDKVKKTKGTLLIPTYDGNLMLGPTALVQEDKEDKSTSLEGFDEVFTKALELIPWLKRGYLINAFAGLRPTIKGEDFLIEETRKNFINVAGIQSPGLTAAPAIAKYILNILDEIIELKPNKKFNPELSDSVRIRELPFDEVEKLMKKRPDYGLLVCRCERVTEGEIRDAIRDGAKTIDGIKFRTRAGMGRCQGGFCTFRMMDIITEELDMDYLQITKRGRGSYILKEKI